jgi:hypothetical protein
MTGKMAGSEQRMKIGTVLPWFLGTLLILALVFFIVKRHTERTGVYETVIRGSAILSDMRLNLLRAAEAEKSSVLAITDEESQRFADQARTAAMNVDEARRELTPLVVGDHFTAERSLLDEFDRCWAESVKLDRLILDLAVQNTNLHATNLAMTKGTEALNHLERSLSALINEDRGENGDCRLLRASYRALVAGLKIHDLYTPHIEAETDEQMDRIEQDIKVNEDTLKKSLDEVAGMARGGAISQYAGDAMAAYHEMAQLTDEIIGLSRKNTNIKSLRLSLGKKRIMTAQCDEILSRLEQVIRSQDTRATR